MKSSVVNTTPFVTIIMPIRNESAFIERRLGAVLTQTYPVDKIEVLIADGMSDDGTQEVIRKMPNTSSVQIIPNDRRRQAAGMNTAIAQARGDVIVRVEGHTIIAPDYVQQCVTALKETDASNVGGPMNPVGITQVGKAIAAAGRSAFAVPTAFHISEQPQFTDTVYMGAWWKWVFDQVGLFDETAVTNEDYELNYRIRVSGGTIFLTPRIKSLYYGRQTVYELGQQYFRYGIGKVYTLRLHPRSLKLRHLVMPVFLSALVAGGIGAVLHPMLLLLWLSVITVYMIANLYFSIRVSRRTNRDLLLRLPIIFFVIHAAWGTGFWYALLQLKRKYRY